MSTNFNIKSMDSKGCVIRILANDKLIDCRFPESMPENQRMGWLKQTANECLKNMGLVDHIKAIPMEIENISDDVDNPVYVERFHPSTNTDELPDTDEADAPGFWSRVGGWFS